MVSSHALILVFGSLLPLVIGQDFTIPQGWTNSTSALTLGERMQIVYAADNILLQFPDNEPENILTTSGTDGMNLDMNNLLGFRALSQTDALTGNTTFKAAVTGNLTSSGGSVLGGSLPVPFTISGLLAMDVYFTYNDSSALTMAQSLWNLIFPSQVQPDQAAAGRLSSLNANFSSTCNSESVAGAVLPVYPGAQLERLGTTGTPSEIAASDVGSFLALSSYLFKATGNNTYLSSAALSAQFVQKHLANAEVVLAGIDIASCLSNSTEWPGDTGFVLEGLATLSSLKNTTFDPFMRSLISTSIPFSAWTGSDGVFTADARVESENVADIKLTTPEYIRGLLEAWSSMDPQDSAALYVESFLMVQYNALIGVASANNSYSLDWHGPAPTQIDSIGQTAALDVLNAAMLIGLPNNTNSTNNSSSSTSPSPTSSASSASLQPSPGSSTVALSTVHKKPVGAIVGGVVGGVGGLLLLLGALMLWRRYTKKDKEQAYIRNIMETTTVPYTDIQPRPQMSVADRKDSSLRTPPAITQTPIMPSDIGPPVAAADEVQEHNTGAVVAVPADSAPPDARRGTQSVAETDNIEAVPLLVERLNRIMARLPPGGIIEAEPPAYQDHTA